MEKLDLATTKGNNSVKIRTDAKRRNMVVRHKNEKYKINLMRERERWKK